MRFIQRVIGLSVVIGFAGGTALADETIVFVRHGEKPGKLSQCEKTDDSEKTGDSTPGLGQLTCQGLNRALKLPAVIGAKFGKPDAIFAPNPAVQKDDDDKGGLYDYVRPLATIEPTAIRYQLPVNTQIGFSQVEDLIAALRNRDYHNKVVVVAWEHKIINEVECKLLTDENCNWERDKNSDKWAGKVKKWKGCDFDRMDVIKIDWSKAKPEVTFAQDKEGLDNQPATCPK
jgi:hypothetical protein